jgi:hypothetical protein
VRSAHLVRSLVVFIVAIPLAWSAGCGSNGGGPGGNGDGGSSGGSGSGGSGGNSGGITFFDAGGMCTTASQCKVVCPGGGTTSISGTVYDPAGNNPLPYVTVYIPEMVPLPTLPKGASCEACNLLYPHVIAGVQTSDDPKVGIGTFTIQDVPVGSNIPLVVQIGKWRMQYSIGVTGCQDNPFKGTLRLPRNASEGSLPDIAISTGGADSLECLLGRIGVDNSEYTNGAAGPGHIHIFQGGTGGGGNPGPTYQSGAPAISSTALWNSGATMQANYDVVLLSCEGFETSAPNPTALQTYANNGGRVFASHFHYSWFTTNGSPFLNYGLGTILAGTQDTLNITGVVATKQPNGGVFPKGQALHDWLALPAVGGLNANGELPIQASRQNVQQINYPPQTSWINAAPGVSQPAMPGLSQYFSFDLPYPNTQEKLCGRIVYSDLHVGAASGDYGGATTTTGGIVPTGCKPGKLSPQEAALEFMLFDLSSCLTPITVRPSFDGGAF